MCNTAFFTSLALVFVSDKIKTNSRKAKLDTYFSPSHPTYPVNFRVMKTYRTVFLQIAPTDLNEVPIPKGQDYIYQKRPQTT